MPDVRQRLTLYEADDETVLAEITTDPSDTRPYLKWISGLPDEELNLLEGRYTIGQMEAHVVDVPTDPSDQATGWLTAQLPIKNRKVVYAEDRGEGYVDQLVGVVKEAELLESLVTYRLEIRDIRERERTCKAFQVNTTATVLPRGHIDGYGVPYPGAPEEEWLIPPTEPIKGTFRSEGHQLSGAEAGRVEIDGAVIWDTSEEALFVPRHLVMGEKQRKAARSTSLRHGLPVEDRTTAGTPPDATQPWPFWDKVWVMWRPAEGGDWRRIRRMPATLTAQIQHGVGAAREPESLVRTGDGRLEDEDVQVQSARAIRMTRYPDEEEPNDELPSDGQEVEVIVRYGGPPSEDWPVRIEQDAGAFLKELGDGEWSPEPPAIPYADDIDDELDAPCRIKVTEPQDDVREWLARHFWPALGGAPSVVGDEIRPVLYDSPGLGDPLPVLDDDVVKAPGSWRDAVAGAVTVYRYTYRRDVAIPPEEDPDGTEVDGDGIAAREITIETRAPEDVLDELGEIEEEVDTEAFRAVGGRHGEPVVGAYQDETGHDLGLSRGRKAVDRYRRGPTEMELDVMRGGDREDLVPGEWAELAASWVPDPQTGERGGSHLMQVVHRRNLDPAWMRLTLERAGPAVQPLPEPSLGTLATEDFRVRVPVDDVPSEADEVAVEYVRSETNPGESRRWLEAGRREDVGDIYSPIMPPAQRVWVQARSLADGRRPSPWTDPVSIDLPEYAEGRARMGVTSEGHPWVRLHFAASASSARIEYDVHARDGEPDFTDHVDVEDEGAGVGGQVVTLEDVTVPMRFAVSFRVTFWTEWDAENEEVSGTAGAEREGEVPRRIRDGVPWGSLTARREGDTVFFEGDGNHLSESFSWGIALVSGPGDLPTDPDDPSLEASGHEDSSLAEVSVGGIEPGEGEQVWVVVWFHPDEQGEEPAGPRAAARARVEDAELPGNTVTSLVPRWDPAPGGAHLAILGERGQETRSVRVEYDYASTPGGTPDTSVDYTFDLSAGGGTFVHAVQDETGAIKFWHPDEAAPSITLTPHADTGGGGASGTAKVVEPDAPGETGTTGGRVAPSDDPSATQQGGTVLFQSAASLGFAVTADGQDRPLVQLTGTATPAQGGTGTDAVPVEGALLRGDDQGAYTLLSPGSEGQVLKMGAAVPDWGSVAWDEVANKPAEFPPEGHTHDASDVDSGTLHPDRVALSAAGDILFAQDAGALNRLGIGSQGQVLTVAGTGLPEWQDAADGDGLPDATTADRWLRSTGSDWVESDWSLPGAGAPNSELHFLGTRSGGDAEWVSLQESDLPSHGHVWGDLSGYPDVNAGSGLSGGGTISGDVTLSLDTPIAAGDGGTGITDLVGSGRLLHSVDASTWSLLSPGSQGDVLTMAGTGLPEWQDPPVGDPNAFSGSRSWIDSENNEQHDVTVDDGLIQSWSVGPAPI